ncbi:MAG: hypothetical protein WBE87_15475, partial [Candidatus Acidiferrales bacterium]
FVAINVKPDQIERRVAREVVIRLSDRRVLTAFECCDNCIDLALKSLQEIRACIVDKQVELSGHTNGSLYLLLDSIREGIRQFLTFEQRFAGNSMAAVTDQKTNELYFAALEMLRAHIHRTLLQISKIADMEIPGISAQMRYNENWQLEAYENPFLPKASPREK